MSFSKFKIALLAAILATSAAAAQADVITFEGIATTNGYKTYSGSGNVPLTGYALAIAGTSLAAVYDSGFFAYSSSSYAANGTDFLRVTFASYVTLTSTSQSLFSVNSIDLANYLYSSGSTISDSTATLTGTFANGTTISKTYLLNNNNAVSTNDFTT